MLNFIKNNSINLFILVLIYQMILCIITFNVTNFQILLFEGIIFGILILIDNIKNK